MAPVGRWQKGRDLNWYAKGDADEDGGETAAGRAERERKEEIKRIKEAEQDALARALGYDVPPRNPNWESLGDKKEVDKILKENIGDEDVEIGNGVGYGKLGINHGDSNERIHGDDIGIEAAGQGLRTDDKDKLRNKGRRSRSRDRDHRRRRQDKHEDDYERRSRSRSRERARRRRSSSRDRTHRKGDRERRPHRRTRSRSPYYNDRERRRDDHHARRR